MIRHVFCFVLCVTALRAAADDDPLRDLKKGQPRDVAALIHRLALCNHWSGEEPYDEARRNEIYSAMADLKCKRLEADEAKAVKRHASNLKALKALKEAKELSY
jgi:hypothetical protein